MPGNEVDDKVRNFFEQGSLSQDQRHAQLVEGNWPVLNNNLWGGNERQIAGPLNSSFKNYSAQQSGIDRGQGNQFLQGSDGFNFLQSNLRPEFVKNPSQLPQLNLNGYMHSPQVVPVRQNEANFLGVDTEPDRRNMTLRGLSFLESQQSGSQHTKSESFGGSGSPMNLNFLGGQQHITGQQSGMLQSLPQQQSAINTAQLLHQQVVLKQMQELQRQQQLQQLEAMQRNAVSQISTFSGEMVGQHSQATNGNLLNNASNYPWQSQVMAGNANWLQHGQSAVQGYSNGLMITPEPGQAMHLVGLIPQQASQSLYGVPVSNSRNTYPYSHSNIDKPGVVQVSAPGSSFPGDQYAQLPGQGSTKDKTTVSGSLFEGKNAFEHASSLGDKCNAGSFNQVQQRNVLISGGGSQDSAGGSERVPGKSITQPSSSQAAVALDPTEQKILFGNDENIWEAFGGSPLTGTGGINRLDGIDPFNGLSSMQSGTWSALMQSAVAETSSSDTGMQSEWSGLGSKNSRLQSGHQPPSVLHDNVKQSPVLVDRSERASLGSQAATDDVRTANYINDSGLRQSFPSQMESQILQEERKWLDCNQLKPHAEQNQALENTQFSRDSFKTNAGSWRYQQSTSFSQNSAQPSSRPSALNLIESVHANGDIASANHDNFHENVRRGDMVMDAGHNVAMRLDSVPNSEIRMGSPHVNSTSDAAMHSLSKVNDETGQRLSDSNHLDLWKPVNSSVKSGVEGSENYQHISKRGAPILESSFAIHNGEAAELHETQNGDQRESLNDSNHSSIPHLASTGGLRENVWSDAGERLSLPGGKEKSSGQSGKKPAVTRKFQYHPMGDVGVDIESAAAKHVLHSQPTSQHLCSVVKGHETQPRFLGSLSSDSMDMEGRVSGFQGADKTSHGVIASGVHPGYFPRASAPFVRSGEISPSNQQISSSQNMLELLHKVDQSKEQNVVSQLSSADCNQLSDVASHGRGALNQSQSSTSHGFSLQLAPPSQGVASSNFHVATQSSTRPTDSSCSGHLTPDKGDSNQAWLGSVSSAQCLQPARLPPQMHSMSNSSGILGSMDADGSLQNLKGKLSAPLASVSPYLRNPLQNQHMTAVDGKLISGTSTASSFDKHGHNDHQISDSRDQVVAMQHVNNSHQNFVSERNVNQFGMRALMHQTPVPPAVVVPGMSGKDNPPPFGANLWTSQQHLLGAQGHNASDLLVSKFPSSRTLETSSFTEQKKDEQDGLTKVDAISSQGIVGRGETFVAEAQSTGQIAGVSQEEKPSIHYSSDASPSNSSASQKNIEAFHRSLKSNNAVDSSHSLQHQMQAMENMVMDPSHRESKRLKGSDDCPDTRQITSNATQPLSDGLNNVGTDHSIRQPSVPAGGMNMLSFSPQPHDRSTFQLPHETVASKDTLSFSHVDLHKFSAGSLASRIEHTGISPQMAPSWFKQYGTLKNGQLLPTNNVPRVPMNKNADPQFVNRESPTNLVAHSSVQAANPVANTCQIANACKTTSAYTSIEHVSALDALVPLPSTPSLVPKRPKKRKTATSDLLPWNKEVGQGIKRLQNLSLAEIDWAQSSNRFIEKLEVGTDANEDLVSMIRPTRRLILTTQLMQQMFRPPSAAILSLDASSNSEVIIYSLARLALGDTCSQISCIEGDPPVHLGCGNLPLEKIKTSERIRDQYFSEVVEDFCKRAKELENDLASLDKRASILDFRLDCQDLERFSVINRFARFHGRSQVDGPETSSSSDTSIAQKPYPLRYVSAHPMPRIIPDRIMCLSL